MASTLELRQVQKGKSGRIHLAVPGSEGAAVHTLCNKLFEVGEYRVVDDQADCQLCRRRQGNKALVSSAFFEGQMGSQLLELSLEQARAGRTRREAERTAAKGRSTSGERAGGPTGRRRQRDADDQGQSTGTDDRRASEGGPARPRPGPRGTPKLSVVPELEAEKPKQLGNLATAGLQQVSENVYRSPAGVVIRGRKRGADWEVAEVVFDGAIQVKHGSGGRAQVKIGDVVVEVSAEADKLRTAYRFEGPG
jgi:hypothetical protein